MPINYDDLMSRKSEGNPFSYTDTQVMLYNLGVGMGRDPLDEKELPYVFELPALQAVPTVVTTLGGGGNILAGVQLNWHKILHGEQRITIHQPLPPSAKCVGKSWISEVVDKGAEKGAVVTMANETRLENGELLWASESVMFARGDGGFGGPSQSAAVPHVMPTRDPNIVHTTETRRDQALLYRLCGDRNPLHAQPEFAKRGGFPEPILHGLCSYGIACRAVIASVLDYDATRIRNFDVRFTSPVFPGEVIKTDIWVDGDVVSFRSRVEARGITSLNNGRCVIRT